MIRWGVRVPVLVLVANIACSVLRSASGWGPGGPLASPLPLRKWSHRNASRCPHPAHPVRRDAAIRWSTSVVSVGALSDVHAAADGNTLPTAMSTNVGAGESAAFLADPMLAYEGGSWYVFAEALDESCGWGVIAAAKLEGDYPRPRSHVEGPHFEDIAPPGPQCPHSGPGCRRLRAADSAGRVSAGRTGAGTQARAGPFRSVLKESFHLSFPLVFPDRESGLWVMVPEMHKGGWVRAFTTTRAAFPSGWQGHKVLLPGVYGIDPGIIRHAGLVYLFVSESGCQDVSEMRLKSRAPLPQECNASASGAPTRLRVFTSTSVLGHPFSEHPSSPLPGTRGLRLAGRPIAGGAPGEPVAWLPLQYSTSLVNLRPLASLSPARVELGAESEEVPLLRPLRQWWGRQGMHTLDAHPTQGGGYMASVDAYVTTDYLPI